MFSDALDNSTRALTVISLCALLALAGCGGGPTGTTTTAPPSGTTTAPATTTTTTTATTTSTTTTTQPSTGDLPADAPERHVEALRQSGSFTVENRIGYSNDTGNIFAIESTARLDLDRGIGYKNESLTPLMTPGFTFVTEAYTAGDTTFQRVMVADSIQYNRDSEPYTGNVQPVNFETVVGNASTNATDPGVPFDRDGTTTVDGVSVTRYVANGEALAELFDPSQFQNATLTDATLVLFVDDDGVFRRTELGFTLESDDGELISFDLVNTYTEVGSTTVSEPDWLDEARAQTG